MQETQLFLPNHASYQLGHLFHKSASCYFSRLPPLKVPPSPHPLPPPMIKALLHPSYPIATNLELISFKTFVSSSRKEFIMQETNTSLILNVKGDVSIPKDSEKPISEFTGLKLVAWTACALTRDCQRVQGPLRKNECVCRSISDNQRFYCSC